MFEIERVFAENEREMNDVEPLTTGFCHRKFRLLWYRYYNRIVWTSCKGTGAFYNYLQAWR